MRRRLHILVAASVIAVGLLAWPVAGGETKKTNQTQEVEDLLQKRQAVLQKLVEIVREEYHIGRTGFESVVRVTEQLTETELELAKESKTRIAVLERQLESMRTLSSLVDAKFRTGHVTQADVLAAQATLLAYRIKLAREKALVDGNER